MTENPIERFAEMLKSSRNTVFFGGAGVSTESGIKDYRSEDGIYNTVKQYRVSPEEILSHTFFMNKPDVFFNFYYHYFLDVTAEPNRAHLSLAKLEQAGKLRAVITQNIDGLHQKAGSKNVIELHGTTARHFCMSCGNEANADEVRSFGGAIAKCKKCGGILKPDVVLYEESLNAQVIENAVSAIRSADLLIIGGTSLAVYPAAQFVRYFHGENTVLINRDATDFDSNADLIFRESIGEVLSRATALALGETESDV